MKSLTLRFSHRFPAAMVAAALLLAASLVADEQGAGTFASFHEVGGRLYCGSQPTGPAAFDRLAGMGIKVLVSVDGAVPEVNRAKEKGLRYVHLPIGYDGVPADVTAAMAELLKQTKEPIFIHCHHGCHRGPAAAAIAGMIDGTLDVKKAERLLEHCGTSRDYPGLWRDVRGFTGVPANANAAPLREISEVSPFTEAMVSVDHAFDELSLLAKRDFRGDGEGMDPKVIENATLLSEGMREAARHAREPKEMLASFANSEKLTVQFLNLVTTRQTVAALKEMATLKQDCRQCHTKHRDN
jgi:protein tyrosine phosphatase (PTP) superfamily phosphohydrolase (DUF442 family)